MCPFFFSPHSVPFLVYQPGTGLVSSLCFFFLIIFTVTIIFFCFLSSFLLSALKVYLSCLRDLALWMFLPVLLHDFLHRSSLLAALFLLSQRLEQHCIFWYTLCCLCLGSTPVLSSSSLPPSPRLRGCPLPCRVQFPHPAHSLVTLTLRLCPLPSRPANSTNPKHT